MFSLILNYMLKYILSFVAGIVLSSTAFFFAGTRDHNLHKDCLQIQADSFYLVNLQLRQLQSFIQTSFAKACHVHPQMTPKYLQASELSGMTSELGIFLNRVKNKEIARSEIRQGIIDMIQEHKCKFSESLEDDRSSNSQLKGDMKILESSALFSFDDSFAALRQQYAEEDLEAAYLDSYFAKLALDHKLTTLTCISILRNQRERKEILFDSFDLIAQPKQTRVKRGAQFEADIFLAASSSAAPQKATIDGETFPFKAGSVLSYTKKADQTGDQEIKVQMKYNDGFGLERTLKTTMTYTVIP